MENEPQGNMVTVLILFLILCFVVLPALSNVLKRIRYSKINSGKNGNRTVSMIKSANKKIEADQAPIC